MSDFFIGFFPLCASPFGGKVHIRSATFITSAVKPAQYPPSDFPEVAFVGRSNVGKSSMINCLVARKNLVKTSQQPGKTQLINFFSVNGEIRLVDLPGYGYAKVPQAVREKWGPMVETYLDNRPNLCGVFLLQDIRREIRPEEWRLLEWLSSRNLPVRLVLTKADKLTRIMALKRQIALAKDLGLEKENLILFSSKTRQGREEVWEKIFVMTGMEAESFGKGQKAQENANVRP